MYKGRIETKEQLYQINQALDGALDKVNIPKYDGRTRENLEERVPLIIAHLVLDAYLIPDGKWVEHSARILRPVCSRHDSKHQQMMSEVYDNLIDVYRFIKSQPKAVETQDMKRFYHYLILYQKHMKISGAKGMYKDNGDYQPASPQNL